jgi:isoquinoline 1-oxidoreductase beta subunit
METTASSRRDFLKTAAAGLVLGFHTRLPALGAAGRAGELPSPDAFLRIGSDDSITVLLSHSEMGQGIWTTLPMLLAEELGCEWARVRAEHAPAAPAYYHTAFGMQMTGGSTTTWSEFERYRQVGALARTLLVQAAAREWNVEPGACAVAGGFVTHGDKKASFGSLAEAAMRLPLPNAVELKPEAEWQLIGKPTRRIDALAKVTGRADFGLDVKLPGLLVAVVARSPVFGGKVLRFEAGDADRVPGVRGVYQVPSGVAVVADTYYAARTARDRLRVEWDPGAGATFSSAATAAEYRELAQKPGMKATAAGDVDAGLRAAAKVLEAAYEVPYLPHACMEPLNCTVRLSADACEVWTGTQFQTVDQRAAAQAAGLAPEQVKVHTMFLGGGFGRRANPASDFVTEAVHVAKAAKAPVKVVWTREDDTRGGYYRPLAVHAIKVGVGEDGMPAAWHHCIVCQSLLEGTAFAEVMIKDGIDSTSVEGVADSPYVVGMAHHRVELHSPKLPVPVLWWRSVGHSHSAFAMECFVDELAHAAKVDPVDYRRRLLAGHARHRAVLDLAAAKAGWDTAPPAGRARGIAIHESFGSIVAQVAEVSVREKQLRVERVVAAIDCGTCVNPAGVAAQVEGAVAFGLSAALHTELTIAEGRAVQSNFTDLPVLRCEEMPAVETHIVPSREKPGGVGEPGVPPIAAAVGNAVFAATGQRLRRLPLRLA